MKVKLTIVADEACRLVAGPSKGVVKTKF